MRVAFYAPLKSPDHPVPSGDRTMARALVKALGQAGHDVIPVSPLRSFLAAPDPRHQNDLLEEAQRETERITQAWRAGGAPELWFTYHNHYKAPDLLGPALSGLFGLPYVVAEASHAARRAEAWGTWHAATEAASRAADLHICFTARDRDGLRPITRNEVAILDLPPFIDLGGIGTPSRSRRGDTLRLVTVAMMRPGDKLASYALLAEALAQLGSGNWHLHVVGDGPVRDTVRALFAAVPSGCITWHGTMDRDSAWALMAGSDLFVWPGIGEAFGLAYLEAQAAGVPVLAMKVAGVPAVVRHDVTGVLVEGRSARAFAEALGELMSDRSTLLRMGQAARRFVLDERTLDRAATVLDEALRRCLERKGLRHG